MTTSRKSKSVPTPLDTPETETVESTETPLPKSVDTVIRDIMVSLPAGLQGDLSSQLSNAIQTHLTRIRQGMEAANARDITEIRETLVASAKESINAKLKELEQSAGPQSSDDMQKLVSQEYLSFPIELQYPDAEDDNAPIRTETFTIREASQAVEKRLVEMMTKRAIPMVKKFQGIKFVSGSSNAQKLQQAIDIAPEILDLIAEGTAIILNPNGKRPMITSQWVQDNVSSSRMMGIIEAQFMANRIRDFFYAVYRVIPRT